MIQRTDSSESKDYVVLWQTAVGTFFDLSIYFN
jgi:hypothetical protein